MKKIHITIIVMLAVLLCPAKAQDASQNYVRTATMLNAGRTDSLQAVQYYNGLGYPTLSAVTAGGNGETAYSLTTYDALGREERKYLPVAIGYSMDYKTPADIASASASANNGDGTAYSQNHHDALDRVISVELPGRAWRNADKRNRMAYSANTDQDSVKHYEANPGGNYSLVKPENTAYQYYPAGSLMKEVQKDADDKTVETFRDLSGNVILQRTVLNETVNLDTYYVYDGIGQLCYVLSPLYQKKAKKAATAYEYRYDKRGRVVKKFLPGAEHIRYWYDNADRVIGMQDGMMRKKGLYRFTLYDGMGRLAVQGLADQFSVPEGGTIVARYVCSGGFRDTGYTLSHNPVSGATPSSVKIEMVNYYDNYAFSKGTTASRFVGLNDTTDVSQTGRLTGRLALCSNGEYVSQVMEYDLKGNLVKMKSREIGGRTAVSTNTYTFTDNIATAGYDVDVLYGGHFSVSEVFTYNGHNGRKESSTLSVAHGTSTTTRVMTYSYDQLGRLASVSRPSSSVSYAYELHGWLKKITTNSFKEDLFYADCPVTVYNCYNGNIGTMRWSNNNYGQQRGYKFVYDSANRLTVASYGERTGLDNHTNRYDEVMEYDANGNITRLQRYGLKQDGKYGKRDNLRLSYNGNQLSAVEEDAADYDYAGSFEYKAANSSQYMYNENGSLVADKSRKIAYITYDYNNNPMQIYFTDGSVTKYVYSAAGQKLRAVHYTAKPNISRTWGVKPADLTLAQILLADSTDYLMGGSLTMKNGRIDKYLFEGGYAQASVASSTTDNFAFYYYNQDHLGNNREVVSNSGIVQQVTNYYPFGAPYSDNTAVKNASFQQYKYNDKELDRMHGLNTYDYGARQYDPVLARWDRVDPLAEKYYSVSPYAYCANNPVRFVDSDGREVGQLEEIAFLCRHPFAASRIGTVTTGRGVINISTNAVRFATRGGILYGSDIKTQEERGSENGAFRHTLWQAQITSEFGADIAKQAGDAHEDNSNIDMNQTFFTNITDADRSVDLHNNSIGRTIGGNNRGAQMNETAKAVLDVFVKEGLFQAQKVKGGYKLVRVKLSSSKSKELMSIFNQLDENGMKPSERPKPENDEIRRNEALQNSLH